MKKTNTAISVFMAILFIVMTALGAVAETAQPAVGTKVLYYNAVIFTNDKTNPSAEAVVVEGGKFAFVGAYDDALAFAGDDCDKVDLKGQFVTPGFFDAHVHLAGTAIMGVFDFRDYIPDEKPAVDQYISTLTEYLAENPELTYLRGAGWENATFGVDGPTKEILDAVNSEIPIALRSLDGHSLWANSKAIEQAGITSETEVPGGEGTIVLNAKGEVSGTIREPAAIDLVLNTFPPVSVDEYKASILKTQAKLSSFGVTGVLDAMVATDSAWYRAYRELADNDELKLHVSIAFQVTPDKYQTQIQWVANELAKYKDIPNQKLTISTCKFFADGVLEGGTAYLKEEYHSQPGYHGIAIWKKDEMAKAFKLCDDNGIAIHTHAIGDAAISVTLDCMEGLSTDHRNALAHIQLVDEPDFARFRELGVVAVVPPFWAYTSEESEDSELKHLGAERAEQIYPIKTFIDNGVVTASHSDFPVSPEFSPLIGIEIAVTRQRPASHITDDTTIYPPLNAKEALTPEQAIDIFTYEGAYANFMEDMTGTITVGKSADFAVIDNNILETPASLATVVETYFAGEKVFAK